VGKDHESAPIFGELYLLMRENVNEADRSLPWNHPVQSPPMFRRSSAIVLCAMLLCGCTYANRQLNPLSLPLESRIANHTHASLGVDIWTKTTATQPEIVPVANPANPPIRDDDGYFVGLAISGGGSRSAVFAAACMFQLQRLGILQRVDYISAVSGGS